MLHSDSKLICLHALILVYTPCCERNKSNFLWTSFNEHWRVYSNTFINQINIILWKAEPWNSPNFSRNADFNNLNTLLNSVGNHFNKCHTHTYIKLQNTQTNTKRHIYSIYRWKSEQFVICHTYKRFFFNDISSKNFIKVSTLRILFQCNGKYS